MLSWLGAIMSIGREQDRRGEPVVIAGPILASQPIGTVLVFYIMYIIGLKDAAD
jgi:hypothetical protein